MELVRESPQPLYQQVEEALRENIRSGRWPHHYKLKPEAELAEELGIARGTVRQAIRSLVDAGLLVQMRGKGTFVTAGPTDLPLAQRLVTMHEVLAESGQEFSTEVLLQEVTEGPARVRSLLDVEDAEQLLRLRRRLVVGDEPFVALENYIRLSLCPGLETVDFEREPLFASIERRCGLAIGWGQRNFAAARAGEVAELLGTTADEPVLYLEQVTYLADERPLEYSDVWVRGEKLRVTTILHR
jgi:DNA-binding GntR family transcriptional regulator